MFFQMIKFAEDVEMELRTQVIQAREIKPGVFGKKKNVLTCIFS